MRLKGLTLFLQISQSLWIFYPSLSRHRSEYPGFISPIPLQLSHSLSTDGLEMSLGEDGVVTLTWQAGDEEGVEVVDGIELVQEPDMVVQRLHEERA
ncbi:hypothetical protein ACV35T_29625 [Pseudomonas aeruginosa]